MFDGAFDGLFKAKLRDNGLEYSEDDYKRFRTQLEASFRKGVLDLAGQRIGINILTKLTKVLRTAPHIRVFNFYGNLIRDHGIHSLLQLLVANPQVEVLDIGCNDLTNQAAPCLIDIIKTTSIRSLQIGTSGIAWHNNKFSLLTLIDIINAIHSAERIECLNMSGLRMSYREGGKRRNIAKEIGNFIANDNVIKSLSLSDCGFVVNEEQFITSGITQNKNLFYLDFHDNALSDPVGPKFAKNLNQMKHLSYLDLTNCQLSSQAGIQLAQTLSEPNVITILKLSKNNFGDAGTAAILNMMIDNQALTEVDISYNSFTDQISYLLQDVLANNDVLYCFNISSNSIGDQGAECIAEALKINENLSKLSLSSCRITDNGAKLIAMALTRNHTLKYLKLNDNFLTCECGYEILDYIRINEHLVVFDVTATQINHFVIKALNDLSKRNKQIQKEVKLQPLKQQIVQLSIQRTKMPEAEMRLANLENERDELEKQVIDAECEIENTITTANTNVKILQKTIEETIKMTEEEEQSKLKILAEQEKMEKEYENILKEDQADIFKEQTLLEELEKKSDRIEQETKVENDDDIKKQEDMQKLIDETLRLLNETIELSKDPEQLKGFEPPEIPKDPNETDPLFLVDQLASEMQEQESARSKRSKKSKKSTKSNSSKKSKGKKSSEKQKNIVVTNDDTTYLTEAATVQSPHAQTDDNKTNETAQNEEAKDLNQGNIETQSQQSTNSKSSKTKKKAKTSRPGSKK